MSATNATTNYSLPLFIGTDKPAWLVDWNSAMTDIDGQMKINATGIQANATSISGLSTTVSAHTTSISTISGEISTLTTGLNSAQGAINTIQSLIGNGEPTTTDKTLIGAINEIYGMITGGANEIEAENVAYDNTTSGLNATDVQAAIDELARGGSASVDADDVTYDNQTSGLTATDVQAAIDEIVSGIAPRLIATSTTGNFGAQIASLVSAFNALPAALKPKAYIERVGATTDKIFICQDPINGIFTNTLCTSSSMYVDCIDFTDSKCYRTRAQSSGNTVSDISSETVDDGGLKLYLL